LIKKLEKHYKLSSNEIYALFTLKARSVLKKPTEILIPISIFTSSLGSLEAIVKFLKENYHLKYKQIAQLINRNHITIGCTYRNARKKMPEPFKIEPSEYTIPVSILKDRKIPVLKNISLYLKNTYDLSYHKIAVLLKRNDRTIWTTCNRK